MARLDSRIDSVTVYSDRALVTRVVTVNIVAGINQAEFADLPAGLDEDSVTLTGPRGILLRDISIKSDYADVLPAAELQAMAEESETLKDSRRELEDRVNRLKGEKTFMERISLRLTGDQGKPGSGEFSPENWVRMVDFYRDRLAVLDAEMRECAMAVRSLDRKLEVLRKKQEAAGGKGRKETKTVSAFIESAAAQEARITLTYMTDSASWTPLYDLRADTVERKLDVTFHAQVNQVTGEDWKGAELRLSTAQAHVPGEMPELDSWPVGLFVPRPAMSYAKRAMPPAPAPQAAVMRAEEEDALITGTSELMAEIAESAPEPMEFEASELSTGGMAAVEFVIAGRTDIPCDNTPHRVTVGRWEWPGRFTYKAVPRLAERAYLTASAVNAGGYPLLEGPARIFMDGAYVCTSELELVLPGEEFEVSLGSDESMQVEFKTVRAFDGRAGITGKRATALYDYRIRLKNRRKTAEEIEVRDHVPLSTNADITVKVEEPAYRKDTPELSRNEENIFSWKLKLEAGAEKEIPVRFTVEYPAGARLSGI